MLHANANLASDFRAGHPEGEDGVYMKDLADGEVVEIDTQHSHYKLVKRADSHVCISGHPMFCPEPVEVEIEGSVGAGSALMPNPGYIGRGMYLMFKHPRFNLVTTSRIREIHTHS